MVPVADHLTNNVEPARLTVSAQVARVERDIKTFRLTAFQDLLGTDEKQRLKVRAFLGYQSLWPDRETELPNVNDIVSFTGTFTAFFDGVAVVTLDDFKIIPHILLGGTLVPYLHADPTDGTVYLSYINLDNARHLQGYENAFVVDALIPSAFGGDPPIITSLRYNGNKSEHTVISSSYFIFATVCVSFDCAVVRVN